MLDLRPETVNDFWKSYEDRNIFRIICFMENIENWTYDGQNEFESALLKLVDSVNNYDFSKLSIFELKLELISVLAYMKTGRTLRFLHYLDSMIPGIVADLLVFAEDHTTTNNDVYAIFLRRNIIFERFRLIQRIFSPDRFSFVLQTLEGEGAT